MEAWPSASANPNRPPCGAMPALGKLTRRTPSVADSMRSWSGPSSIATWSGSAASTTPRSWAGRRLRRGVYFRCFLVGYFEGIDSERGKDQHRQAPAGSRRSLPSEPDPAPSAGSGHGPAGGGPACGALFLRFASHGHGKPPSAGGWNSLAHRPKGPPRCHHQSPRRHDVALSTGC
jgi:hypothetical protein